MNCMVYTLYYLIFGMSSEVNNNIYHLHNKIDFVFIFDKIKETVLK